MFLFEVADSNLIFGLPETADLFILGVLLILITLGLRWFFKREKQKPDDGKFQKKTLLSRK